MNHYVKLLWLVVMFIGIAVMFVACGNSRSLLSEAGPVNNGLRLHLNINNASFDKDIHKVTLTIINTRPDPITLKAMSYGGGRTGQSYADMLPSSTIFSSQPYVMSHPFSTGGSSGLPLPTKTLAAGDMVQSEWLVFNNTFSGYDTNTSLILPMKGLYYLRAHLTVWTADNQRINLQSNEARCSVGGSFEVPKKCSAKISSVADDHSVTLNIGVQDGVQIGDCYYAVYYAPTHVKEDMRWVTFKVTHVFSNYCTAIPKPGSRLAGRDGANPWFPGKDFQVFLVPPPPVLRPPTKHITLEPEWPEIEVRKSQPIPEK